MPFDIQEFKSVVFPRGFQKANAFSAIIAPPKCLIGSPLVKDLMYYCTAAQIPGINIMTQDVRLQPGNSLQVKRPYAVDLPDITLQFICDGKSAVPAYFQAWLRNIVNIGAPGGNFQALQTFNLALPGEVQYPEEYLTTLSLLQYNSAGDNVIAYTLIDAFPTAMSPIEMSWQDANQIATFSVTFSFTTYTFETMALEAKIGGKVGFFQGLFSSGLLGGLSAAYGLYNQVMSSVQQLGNIHSIQDAITSTTSANQIFKGFGFGR